MKNHIFNHLGQSLVQVLISIGLMSLMSMVFIGMMESQQKEIKALNEKMAATDLEKLLIASLADGKVCKYVLNNPTALTFDVTQAFPQSINLGVQSPPRGLFATFAGPPPPTNMIAQVGVQASPISKSLVVAGISLEILSGSSSNYLGRWIVTFDSSIAVRAIRPLSISTTLTVDASAPAAAKITGCMEGLGIAQKWANVPILNGVTYQNTDFKPIQVKVTATGFSTWAYLSIAASDDNITWVTLDRNTCYDTGVVTATIPSQHYYRAWMHGNMAGPRAIILTSVLK